MTEAIPSIWRNLSALHRTLCSKLSSLGADETVHIRDHSTAPGIYLLASAWYPFLYPSFWCRGISLGFRLISKSNNPVDLSQWPAMAFRTVISLFPLEGNPQAPWQHFYKHDLLSECLGSMCHNHIPGPIKAALNLSEMLALMLPVVKGAPSDQCPFPRLIPERGGWRWRVPDAAGLR